MVCVPLELFHNFFENIKCEGHENKSFRTNKLSERLTKRIYLITNFRILYGSNAMLIAIKITQEISLKPAGTISNHTIINKMDMHFFHQYNLQAEFCFKF